MHWNSNGILKQIESWMEFWEIQKVASNWIKSQKWFQSKRIISNYFSCLFVYLRLFDFTLTRWRGPSKTKLRLYKKILMVSSVINAEKRHLFRPVWLVHELCSWRKAEKQTQLQGDIHLAYYVFHIESAAPKLTVVRSWANVKKVWRMNY